MGILKIPVYITVNYRYYFETNMEEASLKKVIQASFMEQFRFESNVILRSVEELTTLFEQIFHLSIRKSKLAICTAKVFDSAIVRNWKTVSKLYDIMKSNKG